MISSTIKTLLRYRPPKTAKRIFNLVSGLFLTTCCFLVAYQTFQNGWTTLSQVDNFDGIITEKGITTYQTSSSGRYRIKLTKKAFYLKLKGLNQTLAVYDPQQNYEELNNRLDVGDNVKVLYNSSNVLNKLNLETFQIEKSNKIILDAHEFQSGERIVFYLTLMGGFILLSMTIYLDSKLR